jgi:pimeloyl-ACP methyl ester carboxylesterase
MGRSRQAPGLSCLRIAYRRVKASNVGGQQKLNTGWADRRRSVAANPDTRCGRVGLLAASHTREPRSGRPRVLASLFVSHSSDDHDGKMPVTVEVREAEVIGTFIVPDGPGPHPGVVALSGSGGGVPSWWGDLLAPHGIAVLAAAYFGVDPLPSALCEIPVETVAAAGDWLGRRPEVRNGRVGLVGGSKGAELALLAATTYPELLGPVAAIAPSCVAWFGVDLTGGVAVASPRSSWTLGGQPVPFVPFPGVGYERTERGLRSVGIYAAALQQADAVAAAAIPVERAAGPLLLLSGGQDAACPSTAMARTIVDRMKAHGRSGDVRHLDFPECGHVVVRPWAPGQAPATPYDNGGTAEALDAAHEEALPEVVRHLRGDN